MKIHYGSISPNARRAFLAAFALGFEPEAVPVRDWESQDFLNKNPQGLVPILEDGSFTLWESSAIMLYLAEKKGDTALYPRDPARRGDISRWMFWTIAHFEPAIGPLLWENVIKGFFGMGAPDTSEVDRGMKESRAMLGLLDREFGRRRFLSGPELTLADYSVASFLMYAESARIPVGEFSNVSAWLSRVRETDAWKRTDRVITGKM